LAEQRPSVVILAGPNGAGKSTAAPELLQDALAVSEFVNADVIARVTSWAVYNCSGPKSQLVAEGLESSPLTVYDRDIWAVIQQQGTK
jgi:adenylate kinase family enzyme